MHRHGDINELILGRASGQQGGIDDAHVRCNCGFHQCDDASEGKSAEENVRYCTLHTVFRDPSCMYFILARR
jgi:hypothetical protein